MIKVTVNEKPKETKELTLQDLEPGDVYEVNEVTLLAMFGMGDELECVALGIKGGDSSNYPVIGFPHGFKDKPVTKVLGKLTEVIVDETH